MTGGMVGVGEAVGRAMWAALGDGCGAGSGRIFHVLPARDEFTDEMHFKARPYYTQYEHISRLRLHQRDALQGGPARRC